MVAKVPAGPGLGIDIDESKVARFARDLAATDRAA
jgi:L-alanine-DL-glutamate epimerase-like enolase superfamily enzyme